MMVAAFFFGAEIAQAADISFSGKIRTRYENETKSNFKVRNAPHDFTATQVRLNAKANINADTSAFVQLQSVRIWGNGNSSLTASDGDNSVGIHEAYFTLKNFAGFPVAAKVGRQQVVLDGHRLFGHTGWTTGAQTHDGIRLTHSHGNTSINYGWVVAQELTGTGVDENDVEAHVLHTNFQGVMGGSLSTYLVFVDDDCGLIGANCSGAQNKWFTIGARQAGKMYGLDYRAEAYFQTGAAEGAREAIGEAATTSKYNNTNAASGVHVAGYTQQTTREAHMFGLRVGKSFKNVTWSPKITLWYDYLSGNSDEDMNEGTWGQFDTLFDTGHKFYGFMDLFLNGQGSAVNYMGLQDFAVKLVMKPAPKWTLKADIHNFRLAETVGGNPSMSIRTGILGVCSSAVDQDTWTCQGDRGLGNEIGSEVDLTLVHKYNANTKLVFGYSTFMAETLWHSLKGTTGGNANTARWLYVMADVKF